MLTDPGKDCGKNLSLVSLARTRITIQKIVKDILIGRKDINPNLTVGIL
jgi:hypothetical protein